MIYGKVVLASLSAMTRSVTPRKHEDNYRWISHLDKVDKELYVTMHGLSRNCAGAGTTMRENAAGSVSSGTVSTIPQRNRFHEIGIYLSCFLP